METTKDEKSRFTTAKEESLKEKPLYETMETKPRFEMPKPEPKGEPRLLGLFGTLRNEIASLIRNELQLAKTEMSEKAAVYGRNAAFMAAGSLAAFTGLILLLVGVGFLIAYGFESLDLSPSMARFLGFGILGLVIAGIGALLMLKAKRTFSTESLKPEKTMSALSGKTGYVAERPEPIKPTSDEMRNQVVATREQMVRTIGEIRGRMTAERANAAFKTRLLRHPTRNVMFGLACGLASGFLLRRRMRRRSEEKQTQTIITTIIPGSKKMKA